MTIQSSITPDERFATPASEEALQRAAGALRQGNFTVEIVDTAGQARDLVAGLVPPDRTVFTASSETLRTTGLNVLNDPTRYKTVRPRLDDTVADADERRRIGGAPDVVVGSVHAVTQSGQLLAASATGSQLGPYAAGAAQAIWVVGAQKVVADLDTAFTRIRTYSYPMEDARCLRVYGAPSVIGKILIMEWEMPGRATVVLVREVLGF